MELILAHNLRNLIKILTQCPIHRISSLTIHVPRNTQKCLSQIFHSVIQSWTPYGHRLCRRMFGRRESAKISRYPWLAEGGALRKVYRAAIESRLALNHPFKNSNSVFITFLKSFRLLFVIINQYNLQVTFVCTLHA
jgi:hypothetical protein